MVAATNYGREYFWVAIVAIMLLFGKKDKKLLALELSVFFAAGIIAGEALKVLYYRDRPFVTLGSEIHLFVPTDTDSSFPSGHALIVGIGAIFSFAKIRNRPIAALLIFEAAIVCYSRVYVGAHYPTDVLAGVALAGALVYVGIYFLEGPLAKVFKSIANPIVSGIQKLKLPEVL